MLSFTERQTVGNLVESLEEIALDSVVQVWRAVVMVHALILRNVMVSRISRLTITNVWNRS